MNQNIYNRIFLGDCIEVMANLPDNAIAGCVTDPPYNYEFIGRQWNPQEIERRTQRVQDSKTLVKNIPYGSGLAGGVRNENWYKRNRENNLEYMNWTRAWGKELYRILKPGAFVFTFSSTRTVSHIQTALEDIGFYARDIIVWRRHSGIPKGLNASRKLEKMGSPLAEKWKGWHSCLRNEWEAISVMQKPLVNNYIETICQYNVGLLNTQTDVGFQSNIFENISRERQEDFNSHITIKPIDLIEKIIRLSIPTESNNIVIDPFLGSGTTALAAIRCGISYIGIEKVEQYVEIAKKRLEQNIVVKNKTIGKSPKHCQKTNQPTFFSNDIYRPISNFPQ